MEQLSSKRLQLVHYPLHTKDRRHESILNWHSHSICFLLADGCNSCWCWYTSYGQIHPRHRTGQLHDTDWTNWLVRLTAIPLLWTSSEGSASQRVQRSVCLKWKPELIVRSERKRGSVASLGENRRITRALNYKQRAFGRPAVYQALSKSLLSLVHKSTEAWFVYHMLPADWLAAVGQSSCEREGEEHAWINIHKYMLLLQLAKSSTRAMFPLCRELTALYLL